MKYSINDLKTAGGFVLSAILTYINPTRESKTRSLSTSMCVTMIFSIIRRDQAKRVRDQELTQKRVANRDRRSASISTSRHPFLQLEFGSFTLDEVRYSFSRAEKVPRKEQRDRWLLGSSRRPCFGFLILQYYRSGGCCSCYCVNTFLLSSLKLLFFKDLFENHKEEAQNKKQWMNTRMTSMMSTQHKVHGFQPPEFRWTALLVLPVITCLFRVRLLSTKYVIPQCSCWQLIPPRGATSRSVW